MKAIVVTDQAAGTAGMTLVERPEPQAAIDDVLVQVHRLGAVDDVSIPIVPEILRSKVELYVQRRELQRFNKSLAEANTTLQAEKAQALERVNRNLEQANAALRDADRHKHEFIAILAHELRNPLAPIRAAMDVMSLMPLAHPQLRWAREVIDRQTTHLSRLVDDLLYVSRISRGTIKLNKELLTLRIILDRSFEAAQPIILAHHHELQIECLADTASVDGDQVTCPGLWASASPSSVSSWNCTGVS